MRSNLGGGEPGGDTPCSHQVKPKKQDDMEKDMALEFANDYGIPYKETKRLLADLKAEYGIEPKA